MAEILSIFLTMKADFSLILALPELKSPQTAIKSPTQNQGFHPVCVCLGVVLQIFILLAASHHSSPFFHLIPTL